MYDENGNIINFNGDPANPERFVEEYVQSYMNKEDKWKELIPPGPRKVIFWLGLVNDNPNLDNKTNWDPKNHEFLPFYFTWKNQCLDED